jgi:Domain of Unknown Function with PDB structure (DUF3857)
MHCKYVYFLLLLIAPTIVNADPWRAVSPDQLAMKQPLVDKNADAEILFRDIRITDQRRGDELHCIVICYVRMKIFTNRGKDKYGTLQIPYDAKTTVSDIAGRTIKPDRTVVELRSDAIFDQVAVRAHGLKIKVKSLAMGGCPGFR